MKYVDVKGLYMDRVWTARLRCGRVSYDSSVVEWVARELTVAVRRSEDFASSVTLHPDGEERP